MTELIGAVALAVLLIVAIGLAREVRSLKKQACTHRAVLADLVDASAKMKARALHIETQLGRTMRAAGVPGQEP